MTPTRLIAAAMVAPMLYLGTGVTERLWGAAQRTAARESIPGRHPPPVAGYSIDFDGIRWLKTVGVSVTTYLVDRVQPFQQVLEDRVGGAVTATYVHLDDLVAAAFPGAGTRFYHYDGQMSTRKLTDPLAAVTDEYTFDAWGITLHSSGTTPNNYLYTGEQFDSNIGLQYNRARYLSVTTGRFLSHDPIDAIAIESASALHRYLYAQLEPARLLDPSGLFTLVELLVSVSILIILISLVHISYTIYIFASLKPRSPTTSEKALIDAARRVILSQANQPTPCPVCARFLDAGMFDQYLVSDNMSSDYWALTFRFHSGITILNSGNLEPTNPIGQVFKLSPEALATLLYHERLHVMGSGTEKTSFEEQAKVWVLWNVDAVGNPYDARLNRDVDEGLKKHGGERPEGFGDVAMPMIP
jgi:RHS repeat-associated protein